MSKDYGVVKDTSLPLSQIRDRNSSSIVSAVLDIQEHAVTREHWLKSLECLYLAEDNEEPSGKRRRVANGSVSTSCSELLRRRSLDPVSNAEDGREYIAVSYTWESSKEEAKENSEGRYFVEPRRAGEPALPSEVRDVVWNRVLNYADHVGCENIWIDRECIDQENKVAQEEAIQSMHLVYSLSQWPIALLTRTIETEEELDLLINLIKYGKVNAEDEPALLALLDDITSNYWWTRAWPFQEDYRASIRMMFLIPHRRDLERRKQVALDDRDEPLLGDVEGEVCINSADFKTLATEFCLSYRKRSKGNDICDKILRTATKYNVLLKEECATPYYSASRSMSPTILKDIISRGIGKESDRLAIMANCCGYSTRLDTNSLNSDSSSLSLSMLALYLLNGEIIENDLKKSDQGTLEDNVHEYISKQSLSSFKPPIVEGLTFIKSCRFIDPILTAEGTLTSGRLWRLGKVIRRKPMKYEKYNTLKPLDQFATELGYKTYGRCYAEIATRLCNWVNDPDSIYYKRRYSSRASWNVCMTDEVQLALEEGKVLRLGSLVHPKYKDIPYHAVFVGDSKDDWEDETVERYAFTSSRPARYNSLVDIQKHVSLEVEVEWPKPDEPEARSPPAPPKLYIKRWLNGLCLDGLGLFPESRPRRVLFPWPRALLE
ncbi:hypothetical protein F4804DRAFT_325892 [Jackrogersella minutella]|nr:hypothetical protein F4804DRAFT_325892 [Jackrogersella minutella]